MKGRVRLAMTGSLLFGISMAAATADESTTAKTAGKVVEGTVVNGDQAPVEGAKIIFAAGRAFDQGETANTDTRGRYRFDLQRLSRSRETIHALVLAPGFKVVDRVVEPGLPTTNCDFALVANAWKQTELLLKDQTNNPVADVPVSCYVLRTLWTRLKTNAEGSCQLAIPPELGIQLVAEPQGAVPLETFLSGRADEPALITLPVLPPVEGRVFDWERRPVPHAAVGRWISFSDDGTGEMLPFFGGARAVTDRDGHFTIAPKVVLSASDLQKPTSSRPQILCFADNSFRQLAYHAYNRLRWTAPIEVTLSRTQKVRIPIVGAIAQPTGTELASEVTFKLPHGLSDADWLLITRSRNVRARDGWTFEEYLPQGNYHVEVQFLAGDKRLGTCARDIIVSKRDEPLDLPRLELGQTELQKLAGRAAPEIQAIDIDTGQSVKLADFRGKVIVLDFWGYWCGPCVGNMPHLIELHRKLERHAFEIVAIHDQSVQSRADYDRKTALARERHWRGQNLPFRVLLDKPDPDRRDEPEGAGMSIKSYGITSFPTIIVIDHDGTVVEPVSPFDHDRLEQLVRELSKRAESR